MYPPIKENPLIDAIENMNRSMDGIRKTMAIASGTEAVKTMRSLCSVDVSGLASFERLDLGLRTLDFPFSMPPRIVDRPASDPPAVEPEPDNLPRRWSGDHGAGF